MFIDFQTLPATARVWLYHIPRVLSATETQKITQLLKDFCTQWEAHKEPLQTSFQLLHEQFIVLAVDETMHSASGCSIDGAVKLLRELGEMLQVDLFDRQYAAYWQENMLKVTPLEVFKTLAISPEMLVFDQTVATVGELQERRQVPITTTWLKRYATAI